MELRRHAETLAVETISVVLGVILALAANAWHDDRAHAAQAIQYVPYDVVVPLSRTYAMQQRVTDLNPAFFGAVYTPEFATGGVGALAALNSYRSDLSSNEGHLVEQYDIELPQLDSFIGRAVRPTR